MAEDVLAVTGAVVETAEELDDFFVEAVDLGFVGSFLAVAANGRLGFFLGFGDELFDAGWMDAAVGDELVERVAGDLAADRVEGADDHDAGRVVDDDVDAGG